MEGHQHRQPTLPISNEPVVNYVQGYPALAHRMSIMPETAIFKTFSALQAQNLLYYGAELFDLEMKLRSSEESDAERERGNTLRCASHWKILRGEDDDPPKEQWTTVLKIRKTLKEYNEALLQTQKIMNFSAPAAFDRQQTSNWLHDTEGGGGTAALLGPNSRLYMDPANKHEPSDLMVMKQENYEDLFSRWLAARTRTWFPTKVGGLLFQGHAKVSYYTAYRKNNWVSSLTIVVTSIMATVLPLASITMLYYVQPMPARLGIIAAFSFLLSCCLSLFSSAKRSDVFAVAAAFYAIQVVFVGTSTNSS